MTLIRRLLSNPVALVGLIRAVLLFVATWGAGLTLAGHAQAIIDLLAVALPVLSLALTGISATAADAKIQQALNTPAPGQGPDEPPAAT